MRISQLFKFSSSMVCAAVILGGAPGHAKTPSVVIPLKCSKGPSDQRYTTAILAPHNVEPGASYTVRINGIRSGEVSHFGLNYIFNMTYDYLVPAGTSYVEGSLRVVPQTGSDNVRASARVTHQRGVVRLLLPGRVENGSTYTPPSFEFKLKVNAAPGAALIQKFSSFRVTANAVIVGDVQSVCEPKPKPFPIATTKVLAEAQ